MLDFRQFRAQERRWNSQWRLFHFVSWLWLLHSSLKIITLWSSSYSHQEIIDFIVMEEFISEWGIVIMSNMIHLCNYHLQFEIAKEICTQFIWNFSQGLFSEKAQLYFEVRCDRIDNKQTVNEREIIWGNFKLKCCCTRI